ncbi:MAG: T9SS type A sorting domain-containing protein, partial [bacterium]|nr:T9SS type A sorting domain-containing protein [bacterium]
SKIPVTKVVYWKVCAIDSAFKNSSYSLEQKAERLYYSRIIRLEPSDGIYFSGTGKIIGQAEPGTTSVEVRIKCMADNKFWDSSSWSESTNTWLVQNADTDWEYGCKGISWNFGERYYVESRGINWLGTKGIIGNRVEFIPVYGLSEKYSFCNYPNPFDPNKQTTCIEYLLQKDDNVKLVIFDINGGVVKEWNYSRGNTGGKQGINRFYWDGRNGKGYIIANGVYFCYLKTSSGKYMTKIMVLK